MSTSQDKLYGAKWEAARRQDHDRHAIRILKWKCRTKPMDLYEIGARAGVNGMDMPGVMRRLSYRGLAKYIKAKKCPTCGHEITKTAGWLYTGPKEKKDGKLSVSRRSSSPGLSGGRRRPIW